MRDSKTKPYLFKFQKHFLSFVRELKLWSSTDKLYIAVSGGIDSIVLLDLVFRCGYYKNLEIIHINHATRDDNYLDEKLIKHLGELYGLKVHNFRLDKMSDGNFEAKARASRYKVFNSFNDGKVLLGHHIDDSFEWSLMQKFKSSTLESTIGIPLFNKHYRRPLMCVTKAQIKRYARIAKLKFNEDSTNCDNNFERNYVRNNIIPLIKKKYPQYLKHYVNQSNALISSRTEIIKSNFNLIKREDGILIYAFSDRLESIGLKKLIYKGLAQFEFHRGKTASQIDAIIKAHENNKQGPLKISGGINIHIQPNMIFMTKKKLRESLNYGAFEKISLEELKNNLNPLFTSSISYPFYIGVKKKCFNFQESKKVKNLTLVSPCKLVKYWAKSKNSKQLLEIALPIS